MYVRSVAISGNQWGEIMANLVSEIKGMYEGFFDFLFERYPNGIEKFDQKWNVGDLRASLIFDALTVISLVYIMSNREEREMMATTAKQIFGFEDIEKILVCLIDETPTSSICFVPEIISESYRISSDFPSIFFDLIRGLTFIICFPTGQVELGQRSFLLTSHLEYNKKILEKNGKLRESTIPILGNIEELNFQKELGFEIKQYIPIIESYRAKRIYLAIVQQIKDKDIQAQVEVHEWYELYDDHSALNKIIFDAVFFNCLSKKEPKILKSSKIDKTFYTKILRDNMPVVISLFSDFSANILEKKTIIEFCVEYLDKPDCDALSYVIAEAVCEVHDYTSSWEESCFKMVKMLLYDFRPYNKSPFQDPTDPNNLKYADKVQKMIRIFNIIIPALNTDERKEALSLLDDKLYGDKYSFFVPRRYEKLIEERRKKEKKMTIEEVKQYLDNFYEAVSNVKIIEELIPGSSTVVRQNSINEILNYMIYLITADGNVSEEDAHICSVISGIKCTPFGIQYSILSSGINFWEFQKQIPHFFNLMISIDNSRLLTRSLSRHSTPSNILLSEMLLTIYKGIGAAILLTNSPVSESKTLRYYTYVNMLDEYLTDNYEGQRYRES